MTLSTVCITNLPLFLNDIIAASPLPKRAVNWMVSMVILLLQSILRSTIQKVEDQQLGSGDIKKENQEK